MCQAVFFVVLKDFGLWDVEIVDSTRSEAWSEEVFGGTFSSV
jgi:hypothetical protein